MHFKGPIFKNTKWLPIGHFESDIGQIRTWPVFYPSACVYQIWNWSDKNCSFKCISKSWTDDGRTTDDFAIAIGHLTTSKWPKNDENWWNSFLGTEIYVKTFEMVSQGTLHPMTIMDSQGSSIDALQQISWWYII